jgi:two-component system chemotaxis response regulator CheB
MNAFIIGGSAGAIEALKVILPHLPSERAFPVIVVLHLLPRGQSLLPAIFRERCSWPVKEAESTEVIENGVIYFAPNDYHLSIESTHSFSLSNEEPLMYSRPSIDLFFKSAASVYKSELTALLLSGANADGAQGLLEILDRGGRCLAQAPETAEFPEMPKAALALSPGVSSLTPRQIVEFLNGRK